MFIDLVVGGLAGVISRTITAPMELYKLQSQNPFIPNSTIREVLKMEGVRSLWKGNATNCMRVFPQTAINYCVFELCKKRVFNTVENDQARNFLSGCIGGSVAITCIYPLETIRSRLSLQMHNSHYKGLLDAFRTIPPREMFQGLKMSVLGFAPFTALSFSAYFTYKQYLETHTQWNKDVIKILGGGTAGITAVSITYPTDLIRRRLQLQNFDKNIPKYSGIVDCIRKIMVTEGITGLYRGLFATYIKLFPTIGIQFLAMERLNQCLK
jgi:hypothetical protein